MDSRSLIAGGIANIYARDPLSAAAAQNGPLGPKMLELSGELADGAHPYNVTPEHTRQARTLVGIGKLLCVEQGAILETNPAQARAIARRFLSLYLGLPNYVDNWRRLGFSDADFAGGGSDRLIDAVVIWGDEKTIRARIDELFSLCWRRGRKSSQRIEPNVLNRPAGTARNRHAKQFYRSAPEKSLRSMAFAKAA